MLGLFRTHRVEQSYYGGSTANGGSTSVPVNDGLKAEPISLGYGVIGRVKLFCLHPESATQEQHNALYAQLCGMARKASGLEDDIVLYAGGAYYADRRMIKRAKRSLEKRLSDKTALAALPDEQRCKILEGILDCINIGERMAVNGTWLREYAAQILPIITDEQILDYARRLYINW